MCTRAQLWDILFHYVILNASYPRLDHPDGVGNCTFPIVRRFVREHVTHDRARDELYPMVRNQSQFLISHPKIWIWILRKKRNRMGKFFRTRIYPASASPRTQTHFDIFGTLRKLRKWIQFLCYFFRSFNPSDPDAPNWRISAFEKGL